MAGVACCANDEEDSSVGAHGNEWRSYHMIRHDDRARPYRSAAGPWQLPRVEVLRLERRGCGMVSHIMTAGVACRRNDEEDSWPMHAKVMNSAMYHISWRPCDGAGRARSAVGPWLLE